MPNERLERVPLKKRGTKSLKRMYGELKGFSESSQHYPVAKCVFEQITQILMDRGELKFLYLGMKKNKTKSNEKKHLQINN